MLLLLTNAAVGAFATWDTGRVANATLSGGNLTLTSTAGAAGARAQGTNRTGKWYFEFTATTWAQNNDYVGVGGAGGTVGATALGQTGVAVAARSGSWYINAIAQSTPLAVSNSGNLLCMALDLDNGLVWVRVGAAGNWNNSASANPATGVGGLSLPNPGLGPAVDYYPYVGMAASGEAITANFGATAFTGAVPSGFTAGWLTGSQIDNAVVTAAGEEVWVVGSPASRISTIGTETWFSILPASVVTTLGREVWVPAPTGGGRPRRILTVSG